jgi:hypothetical protein
MVTPLFNVPAGNGQYNSCSGNICIVGNPFNPSNKYVALFE